MKCWTTNFQKWRTTKHICERQQIVRSVISTLLGCLGNYLGSPSFSISHKREVTEAIVSLLLMASSSTIQPGLLFWKCGQANHLALESQLWWAQLLCWTGGLYLSPTVRQAQLCAVSAATSGHWASPAQHLRSSPWPAQGRLSSMWVSTQSLCGKKGISKRGPALHQHINF